jgi:hypothetical protein
VPRIPTYEQQTSAGGFLRVSPNVGPRGAGLSALGEGLTQVADVLARQKEQDAAVEATVALSKAQSDWQKTLYERQQAAEPGAPEFTAAVQADFDKYSSEVLKGAKTRRAQVFLTERLAAFRGDLTTKAMEFEAEARVAHRGQQLQNGLDNFGTSVDLDPMSWQQRAAEATTLIDGMQMPEQERIEKRKAATTFLMSRAAVAMGRQDPDAVLRRLTQPEEGDTLFRNLTPEARDAVLKAVESEQRARWQEEDRAYQDTLRAEREVQDEASKDMDRTLASGGLSARWLEANRERLSAEDYRYGYRRLTGGEEADTNPQVYADLRTRASNGEDVRGDARDALLKGRIKTSDFDRLLGEVEATRPNWYKRGAQYLSTSSGYSDLNPTPAAAQTKAAMLEDWHEWADQNPKATDQQASEAYKRIAKERSLIDTQTMTITMRAPRFLVGNRAAPDIDATRAATVKAFQEGRIDRAEFDRQARLLKEWEQAMQRQGVGNGG